MRIRLPPELEGLRQHHDPMAPLGVPAHVTLLYPFLPSAELTPAVRRRIARLTRDVRPFDVAFERTGRFPGVVWLAPEPAEPFVALTELPRRGVPGSPAVRGRARRDRPPPLARARRRARPGTGRAVGPCLPTVPGARPRDRGDRRERNGPLAPPLADPVGARGPGTLNGAAGRRLGPSDGDQLAVLAPRDAEAVADLSRPSPAPGPRR